MPDTELKDKIFAAADALEPEMVSALCGIVALPAVNPDAGGEGEARKAKYITEKVKSLELGRAEICSADDKNSGIKRPNIIVTIPGRTKKRLWIISHMDVVPEGKRADWDSDPFKAEVRDGRVYGRGTNDNGTSLVGSIYAAAALAKAGVTPYFETCLCFVANEETGSDYGIKFLLGKKLFSQDDLVLVPDASSPDGSFIETAEKSIFWLQFEIIGKSSHGSLPQLGINACRAANEFSASLDASLHDAFPEADPAFDEPRVSTFEPTRRLTNVANVNNVPGREEFCFDCRVLPSVPKAEVEKVIDYEIKKIKKKYGVSVNYKYLQEQQAPAPTPENSTVVTLLKAAVEAALPVSARTGGIGGGTCAAHFRAEGIPAAVWGLGDGVEHMPNEYAKIKDLVSSAKVFALMMSGFGAEQSV